MIGEPRRQEAPEQVAGDVAGDIGRKRPGGVGHAAMLAEVCEGQRESRGHAQPLPDPQRRKGGEVRRDREERRRQRQHGEGDEDAAPSVDGAAEVGHSEPRDRHAHRCGVDGETHGSRGHPIGFRQRRQDRLGAEQVDDGEERNEADEQRACKRAGAVLVHVHRLHRHGVSGTEIHSRGPSARGKMAPAQQAGAGLVRSAAAHIMWSSACFSSWNRSADSSTAGLLPVFFHQCCTPIFSTETSPILCSIGTEQLLAYSLIVPETT